MTQILMKCSYPNCPVYRHLLLKDNEIEKRRPAMTEDEYFGHLQTFHGYDANTARDIVAMEKQEQKI